ncbi:hypothetical protein HW115_18650 [Verrucomicrobiaceae bacterium N1E253]|uniref:Uncharacterized protein n=1 Tax=Oceaniferula marina TaxID=2748318 RepID=A0A851GTL6_9BACT|nr:hypothetical protein [Oceaniferula marina]NWK57644.1 hypothetical protein [Oceaniferula marina]
MNLPFIQPLIVICAFLFVQQLPAQAKEIASSRSTVKLSVVGIYGESDLRLVRISAVSSDNKKHEAHFLLDNKGLKTMTIPQGFPLRVTLWRPTKDTPYAVVVLERSKAGSATELIEAVALRFDFTDFLDAKLFKQLKDTHSSISDDSDRDDAENK